MDGASLKDILYISIVKGVTFIVEKGTKIAISDRSLHNAQPPRPFALIFESAICLMPHTAQTTLRDTARENCCSLYKYSRSKCVRSKIECAPFGA